MVLQTSSERLKLLPPYLFAELDRKKTELIGKGIDVINLGIGDPDIMPSTIMIENLKVALGKPEFHRYPSYNGAKFFRDQISEWLAYTHKVQADPETEILVLIGSKEGLSHFPQAVLNPGDSVLITDPCYPVHLQSMLLAGAKPEIIELNEENNFLPQLSKIPPSQLDAAKMIVINYPNNPTSAVATKDFFEELVRLAKKHNFIICHDAAYIDICLDGNKQPSLMSITGAKDVAIEFYSFSKMFNACGWRLGFCVGNKDLIASIGKFKTAVDSGQFTALQWAVSTSLEDSGNELKKTLAIFNERKQILCSGLTELGLEYFKSNSTFYVWSKIPKDYTSTSYANHLLEKLGVVVTPGIGFGEMGDSYIRFSLTSPTKRIIEATNRIMKG